VVEGSKIPFRESDEASTSLDSFGSLFIGGLLLIESTGGCDGALLKIPLPGGGVVCWKEPLLGG
jgi:hypothetical protein